MSSLATMTMTRMISLAETNWRDVHIGDVVFSPRDGQEWVIYGRSDELVDIRRRTDGTTYSGAFTGLVDVVESLDDMKHAVDLASEALDAVALCPVDYIEPGPMLAHLYVFHDVRFNAGDAQWASESIRALNTEHGRLHDALVTATPSGYRQHHHDPAYQKANHG